MSCLQTGARPGLEATPDDASEQNASARTILVVDDSTLVRSQVRQALENTRACAKIIEADNGVRALKVLGEQPVDLVLCDVMMPEMSGVAFLRIKASTPARFVPVIMLTAESSVSDKVAALRAGAIDYVIKPFAEEELVARVQAQLRIKALRDSLAERSDELKREMERREAMETELRLAQKLETIGQLAAGIAHEINTPVQFVSDSVRFIETAFGDLQGLHTAWRGAFELSQAGRHEEAASALVAAEEAADLEYVEQQVPKALERTFTGLDRIAKIVRAMKEFSHPEQRECSPADINNAVCTTLTIAANEYKYVAEVETELGEIPLVECMVSGINQVILNLVVNASHAVGDVVKGTSNKGKIKVATRRDGDDVIIAVSDTGCGIPPEIRHRIFDPFFTTKDVGKGTGQGLAIVRKVVVDRHGGAINFESEVGRGTTFTVRLPIHAAAGGKPGRAA